MVKSVPALINPAMLAWARKQARLTPEAAAKAISVSVDKLTAAEAGEAHLTFPQFLAAANTYKRALGLFYLEAPPEDALAIQDFRQIAGSGNVEVGPALTLAIRQANERREFALQLREDVGPPVALFTMTGQLGDDPEVLAQKIRTFLDVTNAEQQGWRDKAFDRWRTKIEAKDALVFLLPGIPLEEMRGAAISGDRLPIILINAKDRTNGRVFTLLHEFCHLVMRASGISGFDEGSGRAVAAQVETYCNSVAAAALVPRDWLLAEQVVIRKGDRKDWENDELGALAGRFGVSREVVLRRLLTLGRTTQPFYQSRRPAFQKEYADLENKKSSGGPARHYVVLSQVGRAYAQLVFQGYYDRRLTLRDVSNVLNMRVGAIPAMEQATFGLKA